MLAVSRARRGSTSPIPRARADRRGARRQRAVDILVNNAGHELRALARRPHRRGVAGAVGAARDGLDATDARVRPGMAERGWGRIVNVASSAGKRPSLTNAAYSVTKAAQLSLSRVFADTWADRGVLVNAVAPGAVASSLWVAEGGLADQTAAAQGHDPGGGAGGAGGQDPARPPGHRGRDRRRRGLPLLRARVDGDRRRVVGRRRRGCNHRLKSARIGAMPPAARLADMHACPCRRPAPRRSRTSAARSSAPAPDRADREACRPPSSAIRAPASARPARSSWARRRS